MAPYNSLSYGPSSALVTIAASFPYVLTGGQEKANAWTRGQPNTNDANFIRRVGDAHLNCLETLAVFGAIALAAFLQGKVSSIDHLAPYMVYLRMGQVLVHLSGTSQAQVFVRANFFAGQLFILF